MKRSLTFVYNGCASKAQKERKLKINMFLNSVSVVSLLCTFYHQTDGNYSFLSQNELLNENILLAIGDLSC